MPGSLGHVTAVSPRPWVVLLRAIGLMLVTFLAVYVPASLLTKGLRLPINAAVPVEILVTFTIACAIAGWHIRRDGFTAAAFGARLPPRRYVGYALLFAAPLSVLVAWFLGHFAESGPLAGLSLAPWLVYLYFVVAAPIQEEMIFRGLLQTALARRLALQRKYAAASGVIAVLAVAILFAVIHLVVGAATAAGALVLGLLAGELRRRSGSLLPAIVCHSIFNLAGILWTLHLHQAGG
ncbi:MAG TPA: type II CAAX endopeptidase family protein [Gammaproteobacteria bacterium]|nr:type II CAAX endopeptidase family protein [Gammaproteobacteria bacterium]